MITKKDPEGSHLLSLFYRFGFGAILTGYSSGI